MKLDILYRINDELAALANEFNCPFDGDEKDQALNEATHAVAQILRLGTK